jgi:hypothetical protein
MRFAFLDEGGISLHEPRVVVAGVFVHADKQLIPLEEALQAVVRKHIPEEDQEGFAFSAKDLWGGGKYFKDRDKWPAPKRGEILDDLVGIFGELEIPLVFSWVDRVDVMARHKMASTMQPKDLEASCHAIAFAGCMLRIEEYMRAIWPDVVAQMVAEDNHNSRAAIKGTVKLFRTPSQIAKHSDVLPLQRIRGSVQFAEKDESAPLQLADICAFLIRRRFWKHDELSKRFYDKLKPWMLVIPREDAVPEPASN